ncbi:MAG TPA: ribokinase [Anaerolineaceae bacterium]|nr:ribokinase [Anaerolineaceae bacterium]
MKKIIVLGSINMDLVVGAERAPEGGETLFGSSFQTIPGGKGANQAVATARLGGEVAMIARVGDDGFGDELITKLVENSIDVQQVRRDASRPTGVALIVVETSGQNRILVVAGANGQVSKADVDDAGTLFDRSDFIVLQLETPLETVAYAISVAKSRHVQTVLNAAPARPLPDDLLRQVDYLLVNESEAEAIAGKSVKSVDSAFEVASALQKKGTGKVILTLGDKGAVAADGEATWHTPAFAVKAVDTTAAGDAFTGGLVTALQQGFALKDAIIRASAAGALAACTFGAQPSLPTSDELQAFLAAQKVL